jgi:macrolide transport system ATP-binding/permease protein
VRRAGRCESFADLAEDVLAGVVGHGLRSVGLAAIFVLGSAGLVASLGISQTAAQQVRDRLTQAALDEVAARPASGGSLDAAGPVIPFPDAAAVQVATMPDVLAAGQTWEIPTDAAPVSRIALSGHDTPSSATVLGIQAGTLSVYQATTSPRSVTDLFDDKRLSRIAVLGRSAAAQLGIRGGGAPGQQIHVGPLALDVVGLITATGRAPGLDNVVLVPAAVAEALGGDSSEQVLHVRTRPGRAYAVSQVLAAAIRPNDPRSVQVDSVVDLRTLRRGVSTDLDSSAALLAVLMLTLATITTANVMTMTVNDRRPEIALRRAVGTPSRTVALSFLLEGALIGALGGAVGSAAGVFATLGTAAHEHWDPVLSGWLAPAGLVCGLVVGILAASRAAVKAARTQPALAIRAI